MDSGDENPLQLELEHWHSVLALRYRQLLEAVTALDLETTQRHLTTYRRLHQIAGEFHNQHLASWLAEQNLNEDDRRLLSADRMILDRTLTLVSESIALLEQTRRDDASRQRPVLVDQLDVLVRFDNILRRHQQRQAETLFPLMEQSLYPDRAESLAETLRQAMQPLKLH